MIKNYLLIVFCLNLVVNSTGQTNCLGPAVDLSKNNRPDTLTTYFFTNRAILTTKIYGAVATSNYSFKTDDFEFSWIPVRTIDVAEFMLGSLKRLHKNQILDTLNCKIFGANYTAIAVKYKRKTLLMLFQNQNVFQDILIASRIRKNDFNKTIDYLEKNLRE